MADEGTCRRGDVAYHSGFSSDADETPGGLGYCHQCLLEPAIPRTSVSSGPAASGARRARASGCRRVPQRRAGTADHPARRRRSPARCEHGMFNMQALQLLRLRHPAYRDQQPDRLHHQQHLDSRSTTYCTDVAKVVRRRSSTSTATTQAVISSPAGAGLPAPSVSPQTHRSDVHRPGVLPDRHGHNGPTSTASHATDDVRRCAIINRPAQSIADELIASH